MRTFEEQISNYNIYIARDEDETTLVYNNNCKDTRTVYTSAPKTCKQNIKTKLIKLLGKEYKTDINNYVNTFFPRKKRVCTKKITEETQIDLLIKAFSNQSQELKNVREENKIIKEKINKIEEAINKDFWENLSINIKSFMDLQTVPIPTQLEKVVEEPIVKEEEPIVKEEEPIIKEEVEVEEEEEEEEKEEEEEEKEVEIIIEKDKKDIVYNSTVILNNPNYENHKRRFNIKVIKQKDLTEDPCEEIYNQHHQKVGYVKYKTTTLINAPTDEFDILEDENGDYIKEYTLYKDFAIGTENIKGEYKPKTKFRRYYINSVNNYFSSLSNSREVPTEEEIKNQKYNCLIPKMRKRTCPEEAERKRKEMRDKFNNNNKVLTNPVC